MASTQGTADADFIHITSDEWAPEFGTREDYHEIMIDSDGPIAVDAGDGADNVVGSPLGDTIHGDQGADTVFGEVGDDQMYGDAGNDLIWAGDGRDVLYGGSGDDQLLGAIDRALFQGYDYDDAPDTLIGGTGDDEYEILHLGDVAIEKAGEGNDSLYIGEHATEDTGDASYTVPDNIEHISLRYSQDGVVTANASDNTVLDFSYRRHLTLDGGAGNDTINGGTNADVLTGGSGADIFVYAYRSDFGAKSTVRCEVITDFDEKAGDTLDFSAIAGHGYVPDTTLAFIGETRFSGAGGEIRVSIIRGDTYIRGDLVGGNALDFQLKLEGVHHLTQEDFVL